MNIIDLRAKIMGLRIAWRMRYKTERDRKQRQKDFLKERIRGLKHIKREYRSEYDKALRLIDMKCF